MTSQDIDRLDQILDEVTHTFGSSSIEVYERKQVAKAALLKWRDREVVAYRDEVLALIEKYKVQTDKNGPLHIIGAELLEHEIRDLEETE